MKYLISNYVCCIHSIFPITSFSTTDCEFLQLKTVFLTTNEGVRSQKKDKDRRDGKSRRCCQELNKFLAALDIIHQDDFEEKDEQKNATCRNGCFEKMDDHPVHTISNHNPLKMDVFPKTFVHIILAAKWLVWHSRTSPRPQTISDDIFLTFCVIRILWQRVLRIFTVADTLNYQASALLLIR